MKEYEKNKVDLHLHMDGSLPLSIIPRLAEMSGVTLPDKPLEEVFSVPADCRSLVDYLKCFDMPGKLLQTKECISYACEQLLRELYQDHVMLAEVRFAPQLHKKRGLTGEEIVNAAISGMNKALVDYPEMKAGLILCMMIGGEEAENLETVELAGSFLGKGVIALDIAGAEGMEPAEKFVPMFQRAKELGIPFTIHAGECGSYDHINLAMDLGASRIGHGVAAIYSEETMERLVREQIALEVCVISNLQTLAVPPEETHPVKKLLDRGICVTINTDNMTVSGTSLTREYDNLVKHYGFTEADILKVQENARRASFIKG